LRFGSGGYKYTCCLSTLSKLLRMKKGYLPVLVLFILINTVLLVFKTKFLDAGINPWVIMGGNTLLFIVTLLSMAMNNAAMSHGNTQGFMRNVYSGFMLKFFVIIVAALLYLVLAKPINKPAMFACLGLYLFYTFFGTRTVLNHKKPLNNGNGESRL
jgi:hypothetical protein